MSRLILKYLLILVICVFSFSCKNQPINLKNHHIIETLPFDFVIQLNCEIVEGESSSSCCTDIRPVHFLIFREKGKIIIKPKNKEEQCYINEIIAIKTKPKY